MRWDGKRCDIESEPIINTYGDHRIAMAFAPLALRLGRIIISDPNVVTKSYPLFWKDLKEAGFKVEERC